jgi:ribosomal-protein-alanine N-acetyltransferase
MTIQTARLTLTPKTPQQALADVEDMPPEQRAQVSPEWLGRVRATGPDPWTLGFAIADRFTRAPLGTAGFKGPPQDGWVEIAYGVVAEHQGNGYATEAAEALVGFAFQHPHVLVVRAHTFAQANASARVLTKCGFRSVGEVNDPEDGNVWRWEKHRE